MNPHARRTVEVADCDWRGAQPTLRRANPVFSEPYAILRDVLLEARRAAGLSQRDLAARIGKHPSHVAMIERGQRRVDALELYRMAHALDATPMALLARIAHRLEALDAAERA
jgi:ribosome-binding protein aMBF1 (putative translation factor)